MNPPLNANDPNVAMLELVATNLGEALRQELVFVGGAIAGLLITDPGQPAIRPTEDVDVIARVAARAGYYALEEALRMRGFVQDMRPGAPICRWQIARVTVDVMPSSEEVLGFSNPWYDMAIETAWPTALPSGLVIQLISAPAFLATKMEAFAGRGGQDFLMSHDMGDFLSVVDGRASLVDEVHAAPPALRQALAQRIGQWLLDRRFHDSLPGHLPSDEASQARLPDLLARLHALTA